jgi:hypothetical protein
MHSIIFSSILMVTMVISPFASAQDRMPPLEPDQMTAAQQKAAAELAAGPRGRVMGPFVPLLRSPEFMSRLQKTGEYLRFHSALGARLNAGYYSMLAMIMNVARTPLPDGASPPLRAFPQ